ncbi:hypothetical protein ACTXT7_015562 [Hymenolepis weldensis]
MIGGWLCAGGRVGPRANSTDVPTVVHAHEISTNIGDFDVGLKVNANASAYFETPQTSVKASWALCLSARFSSIP